MKKLTVAALTALLMSGAAAHAQNNQQHNPHGGPSGNPPPPNNHAPVNSNVHAPGGNPPPANIHGPNNSNPHPQVVHGGPVVPPHGQPAVQVRGGPGQGAGSGRHHLPPGIAIPTAHHPQPVWHGRSWAVGDMFILTGFDGPYISTWGDYGLPPPHRGTHWIYVDGYYLMIGNRTGRIIAEVPADY